MRLESNTKDDGIMKNPIRIVEKKINMNKIIKKEIIKKSLGLH